MTDRILSEMKKKEQTQEDIITAAANLVNADIREIEKTIDYYTTIDDITDDEKETVQKNKTSNQNNQDKNGCQENTDRKSRDLITRSKSCQRKKQSRSQSLPPFVGACYFGTLNAMDGKHPYLSRTSRSSNRNNENQLMRSTSQPASSLSSNSTKTKMDSDSKEASLLTKSQDQINSNAPRTKSKLVKGHVPQATAERIELRSRQRQNNARLTVNDSPKKENRNMYSFASSKSVKDKRVPLNQSKSPHLAHVQESKAPVSAAVYLTKNSYAYPTIKRMESFDFPESSSRSQLPIKRQHAISTCAPTKDKLLSKSAKEENAPRDLYADFRSLSKIPRPKNATKQPSRSKLPSLRKPEFESKKSLIPAGPNGSETDSKTIVGLQSNYLSMQEPSGVYMSTETFTDDEHLEDKNPTVDASKILQLKDNIEFISSPLVADTTQSDDYFSTPAQKNPPKSFTNSQSETSTRQGASDVPMSSKMSANDESSGQNQYVTDEGSKTLHLKNNFDSLPSSLGMKSRESEKFSPISTSEFPRCYASELNSSGSKLSSNMLTQLQLGDFTRQESLDVSNPSETVTSNEDLESLQYFPVEYKMELEESKEIQQEEYFETLAPRLVADPVEIKDFKPIHTKMMPQSPNPIATEAVEFTSLNGTKDSLTNGSNQVEYIIAESEIKEFFQDCVTSEKLPEEIETKSSIQSPAELEKAFSRDKESESKRQITLLETFNETQSSDIESNSMEEDSLELNCTRTNGMKPLDAVVKDLDHNETLADDKEKLKMDQVIIEDPFVPTVTIDYSLQSVNVEEAAVMEDDSLEQIEAKEAVVIVEAYLETSLEAAQSLEQTDEESGEVPSSAEQPNNKSFEPNNDGKSRMISADMDKFNDSSFKSSFSSFPNGSQEDAVVSLNQKQGFNKFAKIRKKLQAIFSTTSHSASDPLVKNTEDSIVEEKMTEQPEQKFYDIDSVCEQDDLIKVPIVENTNDQHELDIKSTEYFPETDDGSFVPIFNKSNMRTGETEDTDSADNKEQMSEEFERATENDRKLSREVIVAAEENGLLLVSTEEYSEDLKEDEECVEAPKNDEEVTVNSARTPKPIGNKDESRVSRFFNNLFSKHDPKVDTEVNSSNNQEGEAEVLSQSENGHVSANGISTDPDDTVEVVCNVQTADSLKEVPTLLNLAQTLKVCQRWERDRENIPLESASFYPASDQENNKLRHVSETEIQDPMSAQNLPLPKTESEDTRFVCNLEPKISESSELTISNNLDTSPIGNISTDIQKNVYDLENLTEDANETENIPVKLKTSDSAMKEESPVELNELQCANQFDQIMKESEIKEFFQDCVTSEKFLEKPEMEKNISENQLNYTETSEMITSRTEGINDQDPGIPILPKDGDSSEDQRIRTEAKLPPEDDDVKSPEGNLPETSNPEVTFKEESNKDLKTEANETENKKAAKSKKPLFDFVPKLKRAFSFKSDKKDRPSNVSEFANITATDVKPTNSAKEPLGTPEEVGPSSETILEEDVLQSGFAASDIVAPTILEAPSGVTGAAESMPSESADLESDILEPTNVETDELVMARRHVHSSAMEMISKTETRKEELGGNQEAIPDGDEEPEKEEDIFYFEQVSPADNLESEEVSGSTIPSEGHLEKLNAREEIGARKSRRWYEKVKDFFGSKKSEEGSFDELFNDDNTFQRSESYHTKLLDSDVAPGSYGSSHWSDIVDEKVVTTLTSDMLEDESKSKKREGSEKGPSAGELNKTSVSRGDSIDSFAAYFPTDNYNEDYLDSNVQFQAEENSNLAGQNSIVEGSLPDQKADNNESEDPSTQAGFPPGDPGSNITSTDQAEKLDSVEVSDQTPEVDLAAEVVQSIETDQRVNLSCSEPTMSHKKNYDRPWKKLSEAVVEEEPEMTVPLNIKKLMFTQSTTSSDRWLPDEAHQDLDSLNENQNVEPEFQADQVDPESDPTEMVPISSEAMIHRIETSIQEPENVAENQTIPEYIPVEDTPSVMDEIAQIMVCQSYENALLQVFAYLDHKTLHVTSQVCKQWRSVSYHPSLWQHVVFSHGRMTSKFLERFSGRCTQLKTLRLENIQGRPKRRGESERFYQKAIRASLEAGLESVLIKAEGNLQKLTFINCGPVITERCLWLVSCYARVLQNLTYRSATDPPSAEVLWALVSGCRDITHLNLSPDNPRSPQQERFNNKCAYLIAKNYPRLKCISLGGAGIDDVGLLIIAEMCQQLERLELYNFVHKLNQSSVENMCTNGFQKLQELYLIHTAVDANIIPVFARHCPNLTKIKIQVEIQDYFGDILQPKDKRKYKLVGLKLKSLKSQMKLDQILEVDFKDCK